MSRPIELLVRHRNGSFVGQLEDYSALQLSKRMRDVGAWTLQTPMTDLSRLLGTPGYGLVVRKDKRVLMSGPMNQSVFGRDENGETVSLQGYDDLIRLWDPFCPPAPFPYNAIANDIKTGAAETVMKYYVQKHATDPVRNGGAADTAVLKVATDKARGIAVRGNARWDILGDLVQSCAIAGGLGISADSLQFDCYKSQDRSREQVFSFASGNLINYAITQAGPSCTRAVTGGQGEGTARTFRLAQRNDFAGWGREIERFFDRRDTNIVADLDQKNAEELEKGQATQQIAITPIDVPDRTYGVDWNLGDTVRCEGVLSVVTELNLTYDENGLIIKPTVAVGGNQAQTALRFFDLIRANDRRIRALERAQ